MHRRDFSRSLLVTGALAGLGVPLSIAASLAAAFGAGAPVRGSRVWDWRRPASIVNLR